jgi:hypothetical protein
MKGHTSFTHLNNQVLGAVFLALVVLVNTCAAADDPCKPDAPCKPPEIKPSVAVEDWIRQKLVAGEIADLDCYSSNPADHIIQSLFLQNLLTGAIKDFQPHRHGINIRHAVIKGKLDLKNAEIPYDVSFLDCQFQNEVDLSQSTFKKGLSIEKCKFDDLVKFLYCNISLGLDAQCAQFNN